MNFLISINYILFLFVYPTEYRIILSYNISKSYFYPKQVHKCRISFINLTIHLLCRSNFQFLHPYLLQLFRIRRIRPWTQRSTRLPYWILSFWQIILTWWLIHWRILSLSFFLFIVYLIYCFLGYSSWCCRVTSWVLDILTHEVLEAALFSKWWSELLLVVFEGWRCCFSLVFSLFHWHVFLVVLFIG